MAGNAAPIYSAQGEVAVNGVTTMPAVLQTAAADYTGIGVSNTLIFTSDATNGSYVQRIRGKALGTNVASVARVFLNNGAGNTASSLNNCFYGEFSLPATTAIATAATVEIDYNLNFALPPNFRLYIGLGTGVAAGWQFVCVAGNY